MTSADHKVLCHQLAADRIRSGRDPWAESINVADVFHADKPFTDIRDAIVKRIKASKWYRDAEATGADSDDYYAAEELLSLIDELADADDTSEFDEVWSCIYNRADIDRVWITTS